MKLERTSQMTLLQMVGAFCLEGIKFTDHVKVSAEFVFLVDGDNEYSHSIAEIVRRSDIKLYKKAMVNAESQTDDEIVCETSPQGDNAGALSEVKVEAESDGEDHIFSASNSDDFVRNMPRSPAPVKSKRRKKVKKKETCSCPLCPDIFKDQTSVEKHLKNFHDIGNQYDCPLCNCECVSMVEFSDHMKQEHGNGNKPDTSKTKIRTRKGAPKKIAKTSEKLKVTKKKVNKANGRVEKSKSSNLENKLISEQKIKKAVRTVAKDVSPGGDNIVDRKTHAKNRRVIADGSFVPESKSSTQVKCAECGKEYKSKRALRRHFAVIHDQKEYQCEVCNKNFNGKESLNHHKRGVHLDLKPYKCPEPGCDASFNFNHSLRLHKLKHSGSRPHQCSECGKTYLTSYHLKVHIQARHSERKQFSCKICGKQFSYSTSLKMHEATHEKQLRVQCTQCDKTFVNSQALKYHVMSKHSEQGHYQCNECDKVYKTAFLLKTHQRRHTTDGNRFMCDLCGRQFMYKSALEMHKAIHKDEKTFECKICKKTFKTYPTLYSHRNVHKEEAPYKCEQCGKAFKTKERCKAHEKRHSGLKPFECKLCQHCFPDNGGLSKHMKTVHCSVKKFVCDICGKATSRADNLRVHMKVHSKSDSKLPAPEVKGVKSGLPTVVPLTIDNQGSLLKKDRSKNYDYVLHDNSVDSNHSAAEDSQTGQNNYADTAMFSQNIPNLSTIDSSQLSNTENQILPLNLQSHPHSSTAGYQLTQLEAINSNDDQTNSSQSVSDTANHHVISTAQAIGQTAVVLPTNTGTLQGLQPSPYMYPWPYMYATGVQPQQGATNTFFQ